MMGKQFQVLIAACEAAHSVIVPRAMKRTGTAIHVAPVRPAGYAIEPLPVSLCPCGLWRHTSP